MEILTQVSVTNWKETIIVYFHLIIQYLPGDRRNPGKMENGSEWPCGLALALSWIP
jgi:hypothetical protein